MQSLTSKSFKKIINIILKNILFIFLLKLNLKYYKKLFLNSQNIVGQYKIQ